jgi:lipid-A-disaccharide synthase
MESSIDRSILVVAGETSGEAHAAGLIRQLKEAFAPGSVAFWGAGGRQMQEQGVRLLLDVADLEAIGPWAAMANAPSYWKLFRSVLRECRKKRPELAILVDFPDFNLLLARRLKARKIPICYFISPQLWAWRQSRVKQIRRYIDLMLVIFPFEEGYYRSRGVDAIYVGNPSAARLSGYPRRSEVEISTGDNRRVALLPGSRKREVELILPAQLDACRFLLQHLEADFTVVKAPSITFDQIERIYKGWARDGLELSGLRIEDKMTHEVLAQSDCAIVKSGTSTLEAMLMEVPFAMVYRVSKLTSLTLRHFVRAETFCLANLVAGESLVPEFVQEEATGENIGGYLLKLLKNPGELAYVRKRLKAARRKLGEEDAYRRSADTIVGKFFPEDRQ